MTGALTRAAGAAQETGTALVIGARVAVISSAAGEGARPTEKWPCQGNVGAIAQLGERFNGIEEVVGSIPSGSTN